MSRYRRKQAYRRRKSVRVLTARVLNALIRGLHALRRELPWPQLLDKEMLDSLDLGLREGVVDPGLKKLD